MEKPKIVMFKQSGCPVCEDTLPMVERLAAHYAACIDTQILNIEDDVELAHRYDVDSVPDLLSFAPDGTPLFRLTGYVDTLQQCNRLYAAVLRTARGCQVEILRDKK